MHSCVVRLPTARETGRKAFPWRTKAMIKRNCSASLQGVSRDRACRSGHSGGGNAIVPSLPIKGSKRLASLELFTAFVRAPAMPDGKQGDMPSFGEDTLEEGQARELYSFLEAEFH